MQANTAEATDLRVYHEVDKAYKRVESLFEYYGMECAHPDKNDFDFFYKESPNLMKRIAELEEKIGPPMDMPEIKENLDLWVKNWDAVFRRRRGIKQEMVYG